MLNLKMRRQAIKLLLSITSLGILETARSKLVLAATATKKLYEAKIPGIKGKIVRKRDENYELWRSSMIWHHSKPRRYPKLIIQALSESDIVGAVRYASENNLKVSGLVI